MAVAQVLATGVAASVEVEAGARAAVWTAVAGVAGYSPQGGLVRAGAA